MQPTGNTILVTGGGSGIGREMARRWHDLGNTVIVAGVRPATMTVLPRSCQR
ncbi:MAG: SDR family NAD(P)-dependent oxidoreductase, partial [Sphingomonadales bacterium]